MGTDSDGKDAAKADELRRHAVERLRAKKVEPSSPPSEWETQRLVQELEIHQIELEMQNAELRQARDEADTALARYTDLYDFAPVGYFTLDREGKILAANLAGAALFGVERSRLIGRSCALFLHADSHSVFSAFLDRMFARRVKESCELTATPAVAHLLFVQFEGLADTAAEECHVAVIDLTGRRQAEAALAEKRREIEELNRSLEEHIARAVDELRQKDRMLIVQDRLAVMGEMINNIAHQWRQPLNILGLGIQELPYFYKSGALSEEMLQENVDKSMEMIGHMSQTIEDFQTFFRLDKERVVFVINEVIARTLCLVAKSFQDQNIGIDFQPEGDPAAYGFPNEYSQVLLNILMNARDALVERGVADALISLRAFVQGEQMVVTIADNAGGIPPEIIGRLFDAYFTTKGADNGTGIGLFMSKTIIEKNMEGQLTVQNTGDGAEFRIEVPASRTKLQSAGKSRGSKS